MEVYYNEEIVENVKAQWNKVKKDPKKRPAALAVSRREYIEIRNAEKAGEHINIPIRVVNW